MFNVVNPDTFNDDANIALFVNVVNPEHLLTIFETLLFDVVIPDTFVNDIIILVSFQME